jgi:hypothetical protein
VKEQIGYNIDLHETGLTIDREEIRKLVNLYITGKENSSDLSDLADEFELEFTRPIREALGADYLTTYYTYPEEDPRSVSWEILDRLRSAGMDPLAPEDIPIILEFLDSKEEDTLKAREKWDAYWKTVDYSKRNYV